VLAEQHDEWAESRARLTAVPDAVRSEEEVATTDTIPALSA
jgi:putative transposase